VKTIHVNNVNEALPIGIQLLQQGGIELISRNGPTLEYPEPVTTTYHKPWQRVLFDSKRDCNPFFHFMEGLWLLAGRNDVEFLGYFNSQMKRYSQDGKTFHGAYGYRMRHFPTYGGELDQLLWAIEELRKDPSTRRCVIQLWDARKDTTHNVDIPCNDLVMFRARNDVLDMTVCNRSNDVIWGAYGANVVHFSMLHEFVATQSKLRMGCYHQVSNSYHAYTDNPYWLSQQVSNERVLIYDPYDGTEFQPTQTPLFAGKLSDVQAALTTFFDAWAADHSMSHALPIGLLVPPRIGFVGVAIPMCQALALHKNRNYSSAIEAIQRIPSGFDDWRVACTQWLQRRAFNATFKVEEANG
jgi:hypothetical protein